MEAIVYTSNAGHTERYAKMLGDNIGLPVYSSKDARRHLNEGAEIIYMGWIMDGEIQGWGSNAIYYDIKIVGAVGMKRPTEDTIHLMSERYSTENSKLFVLQGGYSRKKLKGTHRYIMKHIGKIITREIYAKRERSEADDEMLDMLKNGADYVKLENLSPMIEFYNSINVTT